MGCLPVAVKHNPKPINFNPVKKTDNEKKLKILLILKFLINFCGLVLFIPFSTLLLVLTFWVPTLEIHNTIKEKYDLNQSETKEPYELTQVQFDFFKKQYDEATKEIASNGAAINKWFEYKFFVAGSLLAALIFNLYLRSPSKGNETTPRQKMKRITKSPTFCLIIGLVLVICISIDMQIRSKATGSIQRGLWLQHFVEPVLNFGIVRENQICKKNQ